MQTNKLKNLIRTIYCSNNNNNIINYYINNKRIKKLSNSLNNINNNLYKNYLNVFNNNTQNLCFNYNCNKRKTCIYAKLTKAYKHITNNTYNNMLLLKYLQFYSNTNYKYINTYNTTNNMYFLTTKVQHCNCKLQQL